VEKQGAKIHDYVVSANVLKKGNRKLTKLWKKLKRNHSELQIKDHRKVLQDFIFQLSNMSFLSNLHPPTSSLLPK